MMKNVAILMSTYNGEKYLSEQINSILSQKGDFKINLIVRDDESTDNTRDILNYYQNNNQLKWISGKNEGPAQSFIDLLYNSDEYDYYGFADQDDIWNSDKISSAIKEIERQSPGKPCVYYCNANLIDNKGASLNKVLYRSRNGLNLITSLCYCDVIGCSIVINSSLAKIIKNSHRPVFIQMHDSYISRVCLALEGNLIYDATPHFGYRQHDTNVVGIQRGMVSKFKEATALINKKSQPSISIIAKEILDFYTSDIPEHNKMVLKKVGDYKNSFRNRIALACSSNTKYRSLKLGMAVRLAILFGNR